MESCNWLNFPRRRGQAAPPLANNKNRGLFLASRYSSSNSTGGRCHGQQVLCFNSAPLRNELLSFESHQRDAKDDSKAIKESKIKSTNVLEDKDKKDIDASKKKEADARYKELQRVVPAGGKSPTPLEMLLGCDGCEDEILPTQDRYAAVSPSICLFLFFFH